MKKQTKLLAVLSASAFMTAALSFSGLAGAGSAYAASHGWKTENGSMVYYDEDGYPVSDSWRKNGDSWYYLGEDGHIAVNAKIDDYFVGEDGRMVTNAWVELSNDEEPDSPETPASYWYYFDKNGKSAVSKWVRLEGKWYYFDESGRMMTGKTSIDDAVYYLGKDGAMKTGWVRLEDNASAPGSLEGWFYFNQDGKMVETQYDKKINHDYYTFIDGKMQTGWVRLPADDLTGTIADYRYYGAEGDGKRAEGFRITEGIEGIHDMNETFTFYFKAGKAYAASGKGNELFTISSKKYAFNERGEMQTGQRIVNLENGEIANFYFGDDGVMKTGKQSIYNEDSGETENWYFHTDSDRKGQGFHGIYDNVLYIYGKRREASAAQRYAPAELNGTTYLVNSTGNIQRASASSTSAQKAELGRGHKDIKDAGGKIWTVDTQGIVK